MKLIATGTSGLRTGVPADRSWSVGWKTGCTADAHVRIFAGATGEAERDPWNRPQKRTTTIRRKNKFTAVCR